jgi:hypothetical protein
MKGFFNVLILLLMLLAFVLGMLHLNAGHDWGDDFALYIHQAKSILDGKSNELVEANSFSMQHSSGLIGPDAYPWGYPIILAPAVFFFGSNLIPMKIINLLFFAFSLLLIYKFFSKNNRLLAVGTITVLAVHPYWVYFSDEVMSDYPFLFFTFLSLLQFERTFNENRFDCYRGVLLGITIFAAIFIRQNGIVLIGVLAIMHLKILLNKKEKIHKLQFLTPYITFALLLIIAAILFPQKNSTHFSVLKSVNAETLNFNIDYYFNYLPKEFFQKREWIFYVSAPFFFIGLVKDLWTKTFPSVFFILFLLLLIIWPAFQGLRFVFPVLPFYLYFIFSGIHLSLQSSLRLGFASIAAPAYLFYIFLDFNIWFLRVTEHSMCKPLDGPFDQESAEVFTYIKENTSNNSLFVFFKPRALHLLAHRPAIAQTDFHDAMKVNPNYFLIHTKAGHDQQLHPENDLFNDARIFEKIFENEDYRLYRVVKKN